MENIAAADGLYSYVWNGEYHGDQGYQQPNGFRLIDVRGVVRDGKIAVTLAEIPKSTTPNPEEK